MGLRYYIGPLGPLLDFALHPQVAQRANLQSPPIVVREEAYPLLYFAYRLGVARTAIYSPGGFRVEVTVPLLLWFSSLLACHLWSSPCCSLLLCQSVGSSLDRWCLAWPSALSVLSLKAFACRLLPRCPHCPGQFQNHSAFPAFPPGG